MYPDVPWGDAFALRRDLRRWCSGRRSGGGVSALSFSFGSGRRGVQTAWAGGA
jgi:hypothetical protein